MKKAFFASCAVCLAAVGMAVSGCRTESKTVDDGVTRVLMIGNSFSITCLNHLPQVAADRGVKLDLCSLYIGGCSLENHWNNIVSNAADKTFAPYRLTRNDQGVASMRRRADICTALKMEMWDVVTVQQASHESWQKKSDHPYGSRLVAKIRELAPQAKIYVQETWSYTPWDKRLKEWGIDQSQMYDGLHAAYAGFAKKCDLKIIPFGTAVQEWRRRLPVKYTENSFGGDVVGGRNRAEEDHFRRNASYAWEPNCDVCHLNGRGEYFQALVWAHVLLDVDPAEVNYKPTFVTDDEKKLMVEIVQNL